MEPTLIVSTIMGIINKVFPTDSDELAQKKLDVQTQLLVSITSMITAQTEINKLDAANPGLFSKWREAIGWVCALSFAYGFFIKDFVDYYLQMKGLPVLPEIDTKDLMVVMSGMLGIGGFDALVKMKIGK